MLGVVALAKPRDFDVSIGASAIRWAELVAATGEREAAVLGHGFGNTVVQELLARQRDARLRFRITSVTFLNRPDPSGCIFFARPAPARRSATN